MMKTHPTSETLKTAMDVSTKSYHHKDPSFKFILSQLNPGNILKVCCCKIHLILLSKFFQSGLFLQEDFPAMVL
jgi:hypothetical protein